MSKNNNKHTIQATIGVDQKVIAELEVDNKNNPNTDIIDNLLNKKRESYLNCLKTSNNDITIDNNIFQAFNDKIRLNFNHVVTIELKEYSQPSENVYKFHYDFNLVSGKTISSPQFDTKKLLDEWLNELIKYNPKSI